ncbi:RNA polymerase subunit sigma-70 [Roseovarius atlanticus]|nr:MULTISPECIES: NepR family anti-sigma factor [unclassified Roseovarius]MBY5987849.1 RNA polymerase subunit sigma-70 [Roseovarius atlanticus]MBY6123240.1 RNA polymerase subunit sigma-70 [Roseovarius atlanticus]MBY6147736.1 RNA polymerase subunit sigma-70 [Roseovarius atlanticus]
MTRDKRNSRVQNTIDENLKRAFEDVASEPLPSRFTDLLEQLKTSGHGADKSSGTDDNS